MSLKLLEELSYSANLVLQNWNVSCYIFDKDCNILTYASHNIQEKNQLYSRDKVQRFRNIYQKNDVPMVFEASNNVLQCTFMTENDGFCIIGPFSFFQISTDDNAQFCHIFKLDDKTYTVPTLPMSSAYSMMLTSCYLLTGRKYSMDNLAEFVLPEAQAQDQLTLYKLNSALENRQQLSYEFEEKWLHSIELGETGIDKDIAQSMDILNYVGRMADHNQRKQVEYAYVSGITLITRAIIRGGVSSYDAYALSDSFLQKLSACRNVMEMNDIFYKAQVEMLQAVRDRQKEKTSNPYVEQAKDYVGQHLHEHFTVADIAKELGINESYLSRVCSQEMNMTLRDYIMNKRLKASANLLKYAPASIAQIAEYMCFSSPSHYGTYFKRKYHMSPSEYRKKNQVSKTWDAPESYNPEASRFYKL